MVESGEKLKNKNWKVIRGFLIMIITASLFSCGGEESNGHYLDADRTPDQVFENFQITESDSGVTRWILQAPLARVYNLRKLLVTENPTIDFFNERGERTSVLTADKGEINQETHDFTTLGNVVVTSNDGYSLETETLIWIKGKGKIHTDDFVKFTGGDDVLTGYGFKSDPALEKWEIKREVEVLLKNEEDIVGEEDVVGEEKSEADGE
jgi:LPS export ABC transporter protein LptC